MEVVNNDPLLEMRHDGEDVPDMHPSPREAAVGSAAPLPSQPRGRTIPLGSVTASRPSKSFKKPFSFEDVREYWAHEGQKVIFLFLWAAANVVLATLAAIKYWAPPYYVTIARINGAMLNLNCALILMPVLRNMLTALRRTFLRHVFPFDSNIAFHKLVGWWIAITGLAHALAHYLNYNTTGQPWTFGWTTLAGATGHIISIVMVFMYTTAYTPMRRPFFNAFYFSHHLFIIFYGCLLAHGPRFWYYFIGPGVLYVLERLLREFRGKKDTVVLAVKSHPSNVIEIRMQKSRFSYKPGQYLFLNCPYISRFEWHPFTITSAPEQDFVSVHIRCCGDWTRGVENLIAPKRRGSLVLNKAYGPDGKTAILRLDGPFGAASEEFCDYRVVMLVGAGIGVTPFASILKSVLLRLKNGQSLGKLQKVYFFWISRDYSAFEWFQSMLAELESELAAAGLSDYLEINIYTTGKVTLEQIRDLHYDQGEIDKITGLQAKANFGRPRFDDIFSRVRAAHSNTKIGVFFCGPKIVGKKLGDFSKKYSKGFKTHGVRFIFNKENF
mmetsp:Transcript_2188/g.6891  ORF Transcript_2188/g.6891 Transcript_2188/m.6891 type:complete len:553 (-) Transcript_2188:85-1743(-)|eukprot:CAMPEP_0174238430 /NCGR_PEP_ID=MMETSP0417-20130205/11186_1 /TAXON_ID=242541 /ORGANISM="Mayorella sp, Strain BSH-02190019" /LENGTH=552 /DNA_ID=CAMNT_0015317261 /DNA_START=74 /DNA_END=1732 /DNA_ORIENTATION=+